MIFTRAKAERWPFTFAALSLAVAFGWGVTRTPELMLGGAMMCAILAVGIAVPGWLTQAFLTMLGVVLLGYAFWGRAFAYIGSPPVFIGEMTLALGLLAAIANSRDERALRSPTVAIMIMFALWGIGRTVPYVGIYRVDALRDAVIWGYSAFAILTALFLRVGHLAESVPARYARFLPWLLVWSPIGLVLSRAIGDHVPTVPGTRVSLLAVKPGDVGVHLAGAAAFLLMNLYSAGAHQRAWPRGRTQWLLWGTWASGVLIVASLSRGGLVAVLASIATVVMLRPREGSKKLARVSAGVALVVATLIAFDVSVDVGGARKVSAQQITDNVLSISRDKSTDVLEGSRRWRLLWWSKIVDYTVFGEYFWTGKGFGVNLADDDGFQVYGDRSLRSPHNAHLTILARTGVPGLALWVLLQIAFATSLVRAAVRARRDGRDWWARVNVWILGYWVAFVVNGAFDVFLEGPQGGIWFWSLMGFGIAALRAQRRDRTTVGPRYATTASRVAQPGSGGGAS